MIRLRLKGSGVPAIKKDLRQLTEQVAELAAKAVQLNFSTGGLREPAREFDEVRAGIGATFPWAPLKPPRNGTPLVATGAFYRSVRGVVVTDGHARVEAGGNFEDPRIPYVHQVGTTRAGRGKSTMIPARPYLYLTQFDINRLLSMVGEGILEVERS